MSFPFDVFLSYARADYTFAVELVRSLERLGFRVWLDEEQILPGETVQDSLVRGLKSAKHAVFVVTDAWLERQWTTWELESFAQDGDERRLLFVQRVPRDIRRIGPYLRKLKPVEWPDGDPEPEARLWELRCGLLGEPLGPRVDWGRKGREALGSAVGPALMAKTPAGQKPVEALPTAAKSSKARRPVRSLSRYKLIAFDLDGTLLRGCNFSWTLVWDYLRYPKSLQRVGMHRYRSGQTTYKEWCEWACNLFMDKGLKREDFKEIVKPVTLTKGFYETLRVLKRENFVLAIISGGIDVVLEEKIPDAGRWFDRIFINRLLFDEHGRLSGVDSTEYDFAGKARALELLCEQNGFETSEAVFVGGGFNDDDAACAAGLCIAYPPVSEGLSVVADVSIQEDDLSLILPHVLVR